MFVGIDVGSKWLHVVVLQQGGKVDTAGVVPPDGLGPVLDGVTVVAIDAPDRPSAARHRDDASLKKFRTARCAEIALGRGAGYWVPWVTPPDDEEVSPWMRTGFSVWRACEAAGHKPREVYPHAIFRRLRGGGDLPAKSTHEGVAERARLLASAGIRDRSLPMWSHDGLDAAAAALVAADPGAEAKTCADHPDQSGIWLPSPLR